MLAKLQQTYTHEKQVVKRLNELQTISPTKAYRNKSVIM